MKKFFLIGAGCVLACCILASVFHFSPSASADDVNWNDWFTQKLYSEGFEYGELTARLDGSQPLLPFNELTPYEYKSFIYSGTQCAGVPGHYFSLSGIGRYFLQNYDVDYGTQHIEKLDDDHIVCIYRLDKDGTDVYAYVFFKWNDDPRYAEDSHGNWVVDQLYMANIALSYADCAVFQPGDTLEKMCEVDRSLDYFPPLTFNPNRSRIVHLLQDGILILDIAPADPYSEDMAEDTVNNGASLLLSGFELVSSVFFPYDSIEDIQAVWKVIQTEVVPNIVAGIDAETE